jgi:IS30 family transposase
MGIANRSAIVTLIERVTRKVVLVHLGHDRSAAAVATGLIEVFSAMPPSMRRTLTWDQGKEMSQHLQLSAAVGIDVYFCLPASPWQRGSNENANGLLRDYSPKSTDLRAHTAAELVVVADELNDRPRKTLGRQTPDALYDRALRALEAFPATAVG